MLFFNGGGTGRAAARQKLPHGFVAFDKTTVDLSCYHVTSGPEKAKMIGKDCCAKTSIGDNSRPIRSERLKEIHYQENDQK